MFTFFVFKIPDDSTWNSDLTGIIVQYTDEVTTQINYIDDPQLSSVTIRYSTIDDLPLTSVIMSPLRTKGDILF